MCNMSVVVRMTYTGLGGVSVRAPQRTHNESILRYVRTATSIVGEGFFFLSGAKNNRTYTLRKMMAKLTKIPLLVVRVPKYPLRTPPGAHAHFFGQKAPRGVLRDTGGWYFKNETPRGEKSPE